MINKLALIFGSKSKAQEIVLLLKDAKKVVRQGFYPEELIRVEKYCQENNLYLVRSKFKVLMADEGVYSNKGIRVPEDDKRLGMHFVYISKVEEQCWLAAYHELMKNDQGLGILLEYPVCCVNYFCKNFNSNNTNPMHKPTNMYTNLSKREQDCVLISHFPCKSDCALSAELGRRYLNVISGVDKPRAKELMEKLRCK